MTPVTDRRPSRARAVGTVTAGAVTGLVMGVAATVTVFGWALFSAVETRESRTVPLIVDVVVTGDSVVTNSGDGLIVPALVATTLGAIVGLVIHWVRRRG